mgnify:CR=1 FL=1
MYKPSGSTAPFINFHSKIRLPIQFIFSSSDDRVSDILKSRLQEFQFQDEQKGLKNKKDGYLNFEYITLILQFR